jgi:hypothetical protein
MKTILFLGLTIAFISCKKSPSQVYDYRDSIIGDYIGFSVTTRWIDTIVGYGHDTSGVKISLMKSELDSIINTSFNPSFSSQNFSFKYSGGQFISTTLYHPPVLTSFNDSLYFKHQPGLGPIWTECFAQKTK